MRDDGANMIIAFYKRFGQGTSMEAKCRAVIEALIVCKQMDVSNIILKTNSITFI